MAITNVWTIARPRMTVPQLEAEKVFVPEPIENGPQKLALALGGLAVQSITSLLMATQFNKKEKIKPKKEKPKSASFIFGALSESDEEFDIENSHNIFLMAANQISGELDRFDTIVETHSSNNGFLTIRTKGSSI